MHYKSYPVRNLQLKRMCKTFPILSSSSFSFNLKIKEITLTLLKNLPVLFLIHEKFKGKPYLFSLPFLSGLNARPIDFESTQVAITQGGSKR